jgi:hypothetical protein
MLSEVLAVTGPAAGGGTVVGSPAA